MTVINKTQTKITGLETYSCVLLFGFFKKVYKIESREIISEQ